MSTVVQIMAMVQANPSLSRRALSRQVCELMGWRGDNGRLRDMSCRKALSRLAERGLIHLPDINGSWGFQRVLRERPWLFGDFPIVNCLLKGLGEVEVIRVRSRYSRASRLWNELMERHHYLGKGPLCGAQMRYLIRSSVYGWLGGLSFSAAAWRVKGRDEAIGWSEKARMAHLRHIICNSRFLILPTVKVPHLASHVLGLSLRRVAGDFQERYGTVPVLVETFVDVERFEGTCYRASNWREVGITMGRGRDDSDKRVSLSRKRIFVYPLRGNWREVLCREPEEGVPPVRLPVPAQAPSDWVEEEFGVSDLGDKRLNKRLYQLVRDFYASPGGHIPEVCGSRSGAKAAYRFFDHQEVSRDKILRSHYESTQRRISGHPVVLAVQDTTSLNYTGHSSTEGLGPIARKKEGAMGLTLHDTMVFTPEGVPLGLIDIQCWAREAKGRESQVLVKELPIEEKESYKWILSYRAATEAQRVCPGTMVVSVGDRESDLHELFSEAALCKGGAKFLVRSERGRRRTTETGKLWEVMAAKPIVGYQDVALPRKGDRQARVARLAVTFGEEVLQVPQAVRHLSSVKAWVVYARETGVPVTAEEPLEWMLITNVETNNFEEACQRLHWYTKRWGIEVYHKTLKSGCKIEERQLGHARRIENCLAIDLVVAWRIYYLTKQGRETPDVPCSVFFEEAEWKALVCFINKDPREPKEQPTLREAVRMVAGLGGFLGRKGDGEPGTQTTWRGLQRLDDITATYCVLKNQTPTVYADTS